MGTASPLEIVWTMVAIVGIIYSWINWKAAHDDVKALAQSGRNGVLRTLAHQAARNQMERVVVFLAMIGIGVIAMELPNNPGSYTFIRLATAALFVGLELRIVYGSYCDHRDRNRLMEMRS